MFDDCRMREINIPEGAEPREEFQFVKILIDGQWRPALLEAWIRTPDGWACQIRTPKYRATNGRVTHTAWVLHDPEHIQPLTADDLNRPS